jgi:hypothetical protein
MRALRRSHQSRGAGHRGAALGGRSAAMKLALIEVVYLTLLGGGVFGNHPGWIVDAISRALEKVRGLKTLIVSYKRSSAAVREVVSRHATDA